MQIHRKGAPHPFFDLLRRCRVGVSQVHAVEQGIHLLELALPDVLQHRRVLHVELLLLVAPALVVVPQDVRHRPLEQRQRPCLLGDGGADLYRRGARADDPDALSSEVAGVVPLGGVEDRAGEPAVQPGDVGEFRDVELPDRRDQRLERARDAQLLPVVQGRHVPALGLLVPSRLLDSRVELDVVHQAVHVRGVLEVLADLLAARPLAGPVGRDV
mmetsp:Transcript_1343/g.3118  ORF Transcript_1343/g.3118 Transcript_1343/m.3118 type:complete len:215 (+) Transcript_1343:787-1431(+)